MRNHLKKVKILMHVVDALGLCDDEGGVRLP